MSASNNPFFVTGGTLRSDAPSYVERQADRDLLDGLLKGEFCYVLTSRQMGKSSLMVRAATKLREQNVNVVVLDLTAVGQNLTPEQWYDGLMVRMSRQLGLEEELENYWRDHPRESPVQRFFSALRDVLLVRRRGPVVLFVDELDVVRSLPFSTDEFFAAIRECHNRRTEDAEFARLTFCLLGVASPSDLIRDSRITPFNVGRRIELNDFTLAEAAPLARGLWRETREAASDSDTAIHRREQTNSRLLLERVLYWTNGHPYLTQRLCQVLAQELAATPRLNCVSLGVVDQICETLFLSNQAREQDDNLLFVRERLLRSGADLPSLLSLYDRVINHRKGVQDDETNPLVSPLRLSGVVRVIGDRLQIRNRIYQRAFDHEWVRTQMPDAEVARQRAAFKRGVLQAGMVGLVIVSLFAALLGYARRMVRNEFRQRRLAEERLYVADMNLAQRAVEVGNWERARELLNSHRPQPDEPDLRGFEWRYYSTLCKGRETATLGGQAGDISGLAFAPNGQELFSSQLGLDSGITVWSLSNRQEIASLRDGKRLFDVIALTPDGKIMAAGTRDGSLAVWEPSSRQRLHTWSGHAGAVEDMKFTSNGKLLVSCGEDKVIKLWETANWREVAALKGHSGDVWRVAVSPTGEHLVSSGGDGTLKFWELKSNRTLATYKSSVSALAYSPDGKTMASGSASGNVRLWDAQSIRVLASVTGHTRPVLSIAFAPDGKAVATASEDMTVRVWEIPTLRERAVLRGHAARIRAVAFAPDGRTLATGGGDGTIKMWDVNGRRDNDMWRIGAYCWGGIFSPDDRTLISLESEEPSAANPSLKLWNVELQETIAILATNVPIQVPAFSPDAQSVAFHRDGGRVSLWSIAATQQIAEFHVGTVDGVGLCFAPDGRTIAQWGAKNRVRLFDVTTRKPVGAFEAVSVGNGGVSLVAYSPNGEVLATLGTEDREVRLWEVKSHRLIGALKGHAGPLRSFAFSPNGKIIATASQDKTTKLWDTGTQQEIATLKGHAGPVSQVAFSRDGGTLASGSMDQTVKLWNVRLRQEVGTLKGFSEWITWINFSGDGRIMATASGERELRLWRANAIEECDW